MSRREEWCHFSVRLASPKVKPEEMTKILGWRPQRSIRSGDSVAPRVRGAAKSPANLWIRSWKLDSFAKANTRLRSIIHVLARRQRRIRVLQKRGVETALIYSVGSAASSVEVSIDSATLRQLGQLGVQLIVVTTLDLE